MISNSPQMWLLSAGSHANSGQLAAENGMGLAIALFINPEASVDAMRNYRRNFQPSREFPQPQVAIAVYASTPEKLADLKKTSDVFRLMRDSGRHPAIVYSPAALQVSRLDRRRLTTSGG